MRCTVPVTVLATQLVSEPVPIISSGPLPTWIERPSGPVVPSRKLTLPFELGYSTHATPAAAGSAISPGAFWRVTAVPALSVSRSTGTSLSSGAEATQAVVPVASMSSPVGVAPTATVATNARVVRLTIDTVLLDSLPITTVCAVGRQRICSVARRRA